MSKNNKEQIQKAFNKKINKQVIEELYKLTAELKESEEISSEQLRTVQDRFGECDIEIDREGKKVSVKEKVLWKEVLELGASSEAGKVLKEKYKEVFDSFERQGEKAIVLHKFVLQNFGMDFYSMKFSDYLMLIEKIVDYRLEDM